MYFSDELILKAVTYSQDDYGEPIESYIDTSIWANRKSVARSEFYAANTRGIDAKHTFEVRTEDYSDQMLVEYCGKIYEVIRTYQTGNGIIELTCSDKAV